MTIWRAAKIRRFIEMEEARRGPEELTIIRRIVDPGPRGPIPVLDIISRYRRGKLISRVERVLAGEQRDT
jgi:hypothetical protein